MRERHYRLERLTFKSKRQKLLGVIWYPADAERPPAVLILHGFPGIEKNYDLAYSLCQMKIASMIFHYRGCWGSGGRYSFLGCFEDAMIAMEELISRKDILGDNVAVVGHSFGGMVAIYLSAHIKGVKATVAMSPLANIRENVSIQRRKMILRGGVPFVKALSLGRAMTEFETIEKTRDPITYVDKLSPSPLLLIHGSDDEIVPVKCSVDLYKDALEPKYLLIVRGTDHIFSGRRRYVVNRVANWIQSKIS
ncbi:MAG: alpha/beta fold hydrolase [Candidatus Bathyarchaeia archaeon]|nr:alpha/beta fold hydrolase [Candidatus Bathyarchaeota archaeon]